ncbi:MAG: tungstate ABC transporter substrate-binding protein WtpA [Anaerolineaceae bacterium]
MRKIISLGTLVVFFAILSGCTARSVEKTPLNVFAAGSLIRPFDDLEKAFEAKYPQIDVQNEYHGSIQVIRHAAELHEPIDVVASADHALIPMLMYETTDPESGRPNAEWYIRFATNHLGLAYTEKSLYADEITAENWPEILTRPDVKVGIADPRFDAAGYRAMMVLQLAEEVLDRPGLFDQVFSDAFRYPVSVSDAGPMRVILIPEILESRKGSHIVLRGSSIQLIALLESGDLDYAFEYDSVIQQHGLKLVALPPQLNLGDASQSDLYNQVAVRLDFQRFATVKPEFQGEQIGYGLTIPATALHPEEAELFIAFLLGPEGRKIMAADHHPLLLSPAAGHYEKLPEILKPFCIPAQ